MRIKILEFDDPEEGVDKREEKEAYQTGIPEVKMRDEKEVEMGWG